MLVISATIRRREMGCKIPIGSMYGIFTYIYHKLKPNVGKYTIHGSYGICRVSKKNRNTRRVHHQEMQDSHLPGCNFSSLPKRKNYEYVAHLPGMHPFVWCIFRWLTAWGSEWIPALKCIPEVSKTIPFAPWEGSLMNPTWWELHGCKMLPKTLRKTNIAHEKKLRLGDSFPFGNAYFQGLYVSYSSFGSPVLLICISANFNQKNLIQWSTSSHGERSLVDRQHNDVCVSNVPEKTRDSYSHSIHVWCMDAYMSGWSLDVGWWKFFCHENGCYGWWRRHGRACQQSDDLYHQDGHAVDQRCRRSQAWDHARRRCSTCLEQVPSSSRSWWWCTKKRSNWQAKWEDHQGMRREESASSVLSSLPLEPCSQGMTSVSSTEAGEKTTFWMVLKPCK